ncbi:MAG: TonB-dependent receptor [Rhodospirillaceae bacterium]|nr:MAG: TonB-dependent receptor [Rhodospirillaceae bacterium]
MTKIPSKTILYVTTACVSALIGVLPVRAQQSGGPEEIIVTARRVEERLQDVPLSITVYNQQQLSNRNIVSSTDLAAYTPSLAVNSRFGPDKSSFAIRGFSQDLNTLPTVGVYFADAVAPRLTSNITSGNGAGVGNMFDLQNVQVLKGPQGTLFGRNTTGGAILLVPQKPTDKLEGYVEGTVGNYDAHRFQAVLNVPVNDKIRVRAGVDRDVRDGYLHNLSGIGPKDFNNVNYWAARFSVDIDLTPDLENYTIFTYSRSHTHGTVGKIAFCNRGTVPGSTGVAGLGRAANCAQLDAEKAAGYRYYDVENSDPAANLLGTQWQAINTTTWKASDTLTVKNIASYGQAKESYSFNIDGDNIAIPFVTTYPGPNGGEGSQWTLTEELQFQGRTNNDRLTWQAGGYTELSDPIGTQQQWTAVFSNCTNVYAFQCTPLAFGPAFIIGSVGIAHNDYRYRNYGLYAQGTYKLSDELRVTAGLRNTWDWEKETADNIRVVPSPAGALAYSCSRAVTPAPNPGAALITDGACGIGRSFVQKSHKPTWLIDLDYKPTEDLLIYAKYARGYRGGGVNEANVGAETWKPETVNNYELGAKTSFHGAVLGTFNLAGFWNDFTNQQATVTIPQCVATTPGCTNPAFTGINGIQNVAKSRLRGIEADGSALFGNFRLEAGYAYLDAKVTGVSVPVCDNTRFNCAQASFLSTPGSTLPFAPKNRITLTGTYTLPLDEKVGKVSVGATFTHTDSQSVNHSDDAAFAAGAIPFNASLDPATDLLTLNLNWNDIGGRPVDLNVFATNVTDQKYYVGSANSLSTTGADFIILGEPRMFGVRVRVHTGQ